MSKNIFYIAKKDHDVANLLVGYSWTSGSFIQTGDNTIASTREIRVTGTDFIKTDRIYENVSHAIYYWLDDNLNVIKVEQNKPQKFSMQVPAGASFFALSVKFSQNTVNSSFYLYKCVRAYPIYKSLAKLYARENNQMFFREKLDGKITLSRIKDFDYVNNSSINDTLILDVYKGEELFITAEFNKTDCKFDRVRKSVELALTPHDGYTNILSKYKNTYDLIKCAPATTALTLTKRCIVQIYIQGESVISNYSGGTYWETDVNEVVDSASELRNKYYFYPGPTFKEVNLTGFNYQINSSFKCTNNDCWNGTSYVEVGGIKYKIPCSIKFTKVYNADSDIPESEVANVLLLSDGVSPGTYLYTSPTGERYNRAKYDSYRIEIYTDDNGTGDRIYVSNKLYGKDKGFTVAQGQGLYPMLKISQATPKQEPTPATFNLGEYVIVYNTWVRELCDREILEDGTHTYELPYDDFATERSNYKRCIGLSGVSGDNSVIQIVQNIASSQEPTAYGQNDFGLYFTSPYTPVSGRHGYLPLARSTWGNTSLWVFLDGPIDGSFERWCEKTYRKYTIKDNYHIADVIKALLLKIDPAIKHEASSEYSEFLYGNSGVVSQQALLGCQLYMTQKTNILKGEYDQAAQKAEISLEQVMSMLKDCFKCYWYIDSENRFRIEHVRYFTNGFTYGQRPQGINLTAKSDRFNKKPVLFGQQELQYDKSSIKARYEFSWMDNVTNAIGNISINFEGAYIPNESTESISVDQFCPDIDYMLFKPDDFSKDGFALMLASNNEVPIISHTIYDPMQFGAPLNLFTQNGVLSWRQLINHYLYNASSRTIKLDEGEGPNTWRVQGVERIMHHDIIVSPNPVRLDTDKIVITDIGSGCVEEVSTDIDTGNTKLTLSYEPS